MMYQSTKTYGNDVGLSCTFRQWKADSHCNKLHGYSLGFRFVFEAQKILIINVSINIILLRTQRG